MEWLALVGISFVGAVFWFISAEGAAVLYGSRGHSPLLVAAVCALGQSLMHVVLYFGGEGLVLRFPKLGRGIERTRARLGSRGASRFLVLAGLGAVFGIPPLVALSLMAYGLGIPLTRHLPVVLAGRFVRFAILAAGGGWW